MEKKQPANDDIEKSGPESAMWIGSTMHSAQRPVDFLRTVASVPPGQDSLLLNPVQYTKQVIFNLLLQPKFFLN